jgi:hypothetical protein
MMRSSSYESQNPGKAHSDREEQEEQGSPFFSKETRKENGAFFQTKLEIGEPGDAYEKEADQMADKVVSQASGVAGVQQKEEDNSIQRLATDKEDEKAGTNDARMLRDKEIQEKPEVQRKNDSGGQTASPALGSRIQNSSGKGESLSSSTLAEMGNSFHADFSQVKVHTDAESVSMNKELSAQAFTHGSDVYFNEHKYDPGSSEGKHLLAHELTHVVQQGHAGKKKNDDK